MQCELTKMTAEQEFRQSEVIKQMQGSHKAERARLENDLLNARQ